MLEESDLIFNKWWSREDNLKSYANSYYDNLDGEVCD